MQVVVLPVARRDFRNLGRDVARRIEGTIDALARNPRPSGSRLLRGHASRTWRVRVGDWRILYDVDYAGGLVTILRVLHRSQAY
jgi:mRNA interferase RelE/StbE